jgi:hypothetical protein
MYMQIPSIYYPKTLCAIHLFVECSFSFYISVTVVLAAYTPTIKMAVMVTALVVYNEDVRYRVHSQDNLQVIQSVQPLRKL